MSFFLQRLKRIPSYTLKSTKKIWKENFNSAHEHKLAFWDVWLSFPFCYSLRYFIWFLYRFSYTTKLQIICSLILSITLCFCRYNILVYIYKSSFPCNMKCDTFSSNIRRWRMLKSKRLVKISRINLIFLESIPRWAGHVIASFSTYWNMKLLIYYDIH